MIVLVLLVAVVVFAWYLLVADEGRKLDRRRTAQWVARQRELDFRADPGAHQ